jgi:hypothetical protein
MAGQCAVGRISGGQMRARFAWQLGTRRHNPRRQENLSRSVSLLARKQNTRSPIVTFLAGKEKYTFTYCHSACRQAAFTGVTVGFACRQGAQTCGGGFPLLQLKQVGRMLREIHLPASSSNGRSVISPCRQAAATIAP